MAYNLLKNYLKSIQSKKLDTNKASYPKYSKTIWYICKFQKKRLARIHLSYICKTGSKQ